MLDPVLLVIAGCNGAGKSSFSKSLAPPDIVPFDYDLHFLRNYRSLMDSELREAMAHNLAFNELENQIDNALAVNGDFCYETTFNSTPLHWPEYFKQNGYKLHLIYLCLDSIEEAQRRVAIRVKNGGHFVSENEIKKRYFEGFANLNSHFSFFDFVDVFDTSAYSEKPGYILSVEGGVTIAKDVIPKYLVPLIPGIIKKN